MLTSETLPVRGPALDDFSFPADVALFAVGDVHGQAAALRDLLDEFGRTPTPGRERVLVFLGDLIDRGPDSLGCLETAFHEARDRADVDRIHYLPGNHELLLAGGLQEAAETGEPLDQAGCWMMNGGAAVMDEASDLFPDLNAHSMAPIRAAANALAPCGDFVREVRSWPSHLRIGDVLCVHAGVMPGKPLSHTLDLAQNQHFPKDNAGYDLHARHWAWIRDKFLAWQGGWPENGRNDAGNGLLVLHGHTVPAKARLARNAGPETLPEIFSRMETNARVCLDGGAAKGVGVMGSMTTDRGVELTFAPARVPDPERDAVPTP